MLSRRSFLAAGAGAVALSACGGGGGGSRGGGLNLLVVTPEAVAGQPSRLVFVLQDAQREYVRPERAVLRFGQTMESFTSPRVEAIVHADALTAPPYLTVEAQLAPAGTVWVQVEADGQRAVAPITVAPRLSGVQPGEALPGLQTPTTTDPAGVELVCTRQPACPWHDVSLDAALAERRPMAVLVATPAFCQTAACGPVLDVLQAAAPVAGDRVRFLHLEVYAKKPAGPEVTRTPLSPAVQAFGLTSEPILFLVGADGKVRSRLDGLYGRAEAEAALKGLLS